MRPHRKPGQYPRIVAERVKVPKKDCCDEVQRLYDYLRQLHRTVAGMYYTIWPGGGGGGGPPEPPTWPPP